MALLFIEVKNWSDFQEREDRSNYVWFKFSNDFFSDRKLRLVPLRARFSFAYILCERSKSKKNYAEVNLEYAAFELEITQDDFLKDIELLESIAVISRISQENPGAYRLDKKRKEENRLEKKREEKKPPAQAPESLFDFEGIAKKFPNPKGRTEGIARLRKLITTQEAFDRFAKAVENYAGQCQLDGTELKFIKHFSSFVGSPKSRPFEDWIDLAPKAPAPSRKSNGDYATAREQGNRAAAEAYLASISQIESESA